MAFSAAIPPGTSLDALRALGADLVESRAIDELARAELDRLEAKIEPTIRGKRRFEEHESYVVWFVKSLEADAGPAEVLAWDGLAKLLSFDDSAGRVSEAHRRGVLSHVDAHFEDDLAVIGEGCALVVDPSGERQVVDVLEYVRSQLLELRHFDARLDDELRDTYAEFTRHRSALATTLRNPYGRLAHDVSRRLVEVTQFTERIERSMKIAEGAWLGRIYRAALEAFRVREVQDSVLRKQELVSRVYEMLKGEAEAVRGLVLEVTVIVLIVVEVLLAFREK
jgi:hypothetical protein